MSRYGVKQLLAYAVTKVNQQSKIKLVTRMYNFKCITWDKNIFEFGKTTVKIILDQDNDVFAIDFWWTLNQPELDSMLVRINKHEKVINEDEDSFLIKYHTRNWTYKMFFECFHDVSTFISTHPEYYK
jgi:hypothetical protein